MLACALAGTTTAALGGTSTAPTGTPSPSDRHRPGQTSDGVPGEIALQVPAFLRGPTVRSRATSWQVSPGVRLSRWSETDARGPNRFYLLTIKPSTPGVRLDYASAGSVRTTAPVRDILARDGAVAGVNGDFYDIGDTGAPLGLGRDRDRGLIHGRNGGWNSAFFLDRHGHPDIGTLPMLASYQQHPRFRITNVNSPFVKPGGIGIYTSAWGRTDGYRVTDGQKRNLRILTVRDGRVVASKTTISKDQKINGMLLIGRGRGARDLAKVKVGTRANLGWSLEGRPRMAISGNKILVRNGVIEVVDDREMHPRTAIGIDRDTGEVLLLAVDGRQPDSRGYTMVELANQMIDLGADEALNLDGGGSTTMVAKRPDGVVGVVNRPSDGFQRSVANALEVTYKRPK
ncbi:MAG: Exopolysaccharide biosynthesis protein-like protein [Nocardioides sp.]|nr:Exopolysaccharide biosynthesis protein-like protein [Nocardioides sp.]